MKSILFIPFLIGFKITNAQSLFLNPQTFKYSEAGIRAFNEERFFFQGATSVNTTEQLSTSLQGSQKFVFTARVKNQHKKKPGFDFSIGMNVMNLKPIGVANDSFDLTSLMFPETGNFGLMINPTLHWGLILDKNDKVLHRFSSEFSYSLRQNEVNNVYIKDINGNILSDAMTVQFTVLNSNLMPIRYNFYYQSDENFKIDFNIGFYLNWFNLPNEDVLSFNKLYPVDNPLFKTTDNSLIRSLGLKLSCSINGFLIFADIRQNRDTNDFADDNPFKGFVYNAGIAQNVSIFSK